MQQTPLCQSHRTQNEGHQLESDVRFSRSPTREEVLFVLRDNRKDANTLWHQRARCLEYKLVQKKYTPDRPPPIGMEVTNRRKGMMSSSFRGWYLQPDRSTAMLEDYARSTEHRTFRRCIEHHNADRAYVSGNLKEFPPQVRRLMRKAQRPSVLTLDCMTGHSKPCCHGDNKLGKHGCAEEGRDFGITDMEFRGGRSEGRYTAAAPAIRRMRPKELLSLNMADL